MARKKTTVMVTMTDLTKAYVNFCNYKRLNQTGRSHNTFEMFLGVTYQWHVPTQPMVYHAAKKVELLCNPNFYTLMKIREVRRRKWK